MNLRIKALKDFANLTNALFQKKNYLYYVRICTQIRFVFMHFLSFLLLAFKKQQNKRVQKRLLYFIRFNLKFTLIDNQFNGIVFFMLIFLF